MSFAASRPADHWKITAENTALIIVDMQNIWAHPRGSRYLPMSEDILPRIRDLRDYCHARRLPVVYLYTTKRKDLADVGIFADLKPHTHDAENQWNNFEGTIGAEIVDGLKPAPDDIVVKKFRYSGFYGTQLENLLRALGRDTIAITGVATN
ncbi:MAG: isochorismatase family protein, partial [Candidatus Binatia bacterium]